MAEVQSLAEASQKLQAYSDELCMGSSDMGRNFGQVSKDGKPYAVISYNGRIWDLDGNEIVGEVLALK